MRTELERLRERITLLQNHNEEELDSDAAYGGDHTDSVNRRDMEISEIYQQIHRLEQERARALDMLTDLDDDLATLHADPLIMDGTNFNAQEDNILDEMKELRERIRSIGD